MARKIKAHTLKKRDALTVAAVPGGKIYTREDGAERFAASSSGSLPQLTYTQVKRDSSNIQGKII